MVRVQRYKSKKTPRIKDPLKLHRCQNESHLITKIIWKMVIKILTLGIKCLSFDIYSKGQILIIPEPRDNPELMAFATSPIENVRIVVSHKSLHKIESFQKRVIIYSSLVKWINYRSQTWKRSTFTIINIKIFQSPLVSSWISLES